MKNKNKLVELQNLIVQRARQQQLRAYLYNILSKQLSYCLDRNQNKC